MMPSPYIGRFAPSPSGPLHFGSLVTAVASFLDAKANKGKWLVRIEDIDPPREIPGADKLILETLQAFGLTWDDDVLYQSQRHQAYQTQLDTWFNQQQAYACDCSRKQIKQMGGVYRQTCRTRKLAFNEHAIRFKNDHAVTQFNDLFLGKQTFEHQKAGEDFIIHRRDGLFAYQLAVVLDDIEQKITHVVRGQDLLDTSIWQMSLMLTLKHKAPRYGHIPLVLDNNGLKLSKQNHAPGINTQDAPKLLYQALSYLTLSPPKALILESNETIIQWAIEHWPRLDKNLS